MPSRLGITLISLLAGAALVPAQQGRGEGAGPLTFAADVALAVFNVTVTDEKGRHVAGLTARDFQVDEDGRLQAITLFDGADLPASVGLIVDSSGSMLGKRSDVIQAALLRTPLSGFTALYDALALGIDRLKTGTRTRKALVVLSDGGDNASRRSLDDVLREGRRSTATIYTSGIYDETDVDRNPRVLRTIADVSGGRAYFPRALTDLDRVCRQHSQSIHRRVRVEQRNRDGMYRRVTITSHETADKGCA